MSSKLTFIFVLAGALLCSCTNWARVPIDDFKSVSGTWNASGKKPYRFEFPLVIKEEGVVQFPQEDYKAPLGIINGRMQYKERAGYTVYVTLNQNKEGKRILKGYREDGLTWKAKPPNP